MDCAICFDEIGPARAALGCGHSFHINCIVSWYYRQNMQCEIEKHEYEAGQTASSCPCCRAAPASKLDDLPNEQLINGVTHDSESDTLALSEGGEGGPDAEEDEELAAASPRSPPVPPLDLSSLQLRWTRTSPTSWERAVELPELPEEPQSWDGASADGPPPDSLVQQVVTAARKIQAAWRAAHTPSPPSVE